MMRKMFYILFLILGFCVQPGYSQTGELAYAETNSVGDLNPYTDATARGPSNRLYSILYDGLVRYDFASNQIVPVLAKEWKMSPDFLQVTFNLRKKVTWHDGKKFTGKDVVFTYAFIKSSGRTREQLSRRFDFVTSVTMSDDHTVIFRFSKPSRYVLPLFGARIIPKHLFAPDYLPKSQSEALSIKPVGTGPYKFIKKTLNGDIALEVNTKYWGDKASIEKVQMFDIPDEQTLIGSVIYGRTKLLVRVPPTQIGKIEASGRFNLEPYQSFTIHAFGYNNANPILTDSRVRKALTFAVNRKKLLQWYAGKGLEIAGPFVPASPYFNPDVQTLPFAPKVAKKMLKDLGYRDRDRDGIRESATTGAPMSFKLVIPVDKEASSTVTQNVAQSYVTYMKDIGVEVKTVDMDFDEYLRAIFYDHSFDVAWLTWTFDSSYDITDLFYSKENYPGGNNFISYDNDQINILINLFQRSTDKERRRSIMFNIQKILANDCPYTFLYTIDNYAAIHQSFTGTQVDPYYFFTFLPKWIYDPGIGD